MSDLFFQVGLTLFAQTAAEADNLRKDNALLRAGLQRQTELEAAARALLRCSDPPPRGDRWQVPRAAITALATALDNLAASESEEADG